MESAISRGRHQSRAAPTRLTDALGSTIALTDSSGVPGTQYSFEPFGATVSSGANSSNASQFTGRENDGTGLYYYRARYYDPLAGRFLGEDPLGFAAGINFYAYALNDPVRLTDASASTSTSVSTGTWYPRDFFEYLPPVTAKPPPKVIR